jgi:hypothetical protein
VNFNYFGMAVTFTSTIDAASRNHHWREDIGAIITGAKTSAQSSLARRHRRNHHWRKQIGPRQEQAATEQLLITLNSAGG